MAKPTILGDQFNCSVCLGQLNDPVTIPCGHSYCMSCIKDHWDQADQIGVYRCPLCMQRFTTRPVSSKNILMTKMIEKLKMIQIQPAVPAHFRAGLGDYVECDICTGTIKRRAAKSCLVCLESFCQTHFEHHEEFHTDKPNKSHDAVTAVAENTENHHYVETTQLMKDQKSAVSRAEGLLGRETNEPRRTDAELKKHLRTRDYIRLLQSLQSLSDSGSQLKETLEDFRKERIQNIKGRESLSRTEPKLRPRPFSVALQPSTSTVLEPWARSTSTSESLARSITFPLLLRSYSLIAQKPQPRAFTSPESQPKPLTKPKSQFGTSTAPQISISTATEPQLRTSTSPMSQFRTPTAPQISISTASVSKLSTSTSQFRTPTAPQISISTASVSELRTSTSPMSQFRTPTAPQISISTASVSELKTSTSPTSQFRTPTAPQISISTASVSQLRTSTSPTSQFRTPTAPHISISTASVSELRTSTSPTSQFRTPTAPQISISAASVSQLRTSTSPKSQFRTSTAPEAQFNNVVEELKSRLLKKK